MAEWTKKIGKAIETKLEKATARRLEGDIPGHDPLEDLENLQKKINTITKWCKEVFTSRGRGR